jgi:hypothetical protein
MNINIAKAYQTLSYDASCVKAGVRPIQIITEQKARTYMATKIKNLEYNTPLEVRSCQHPAEIVIIHEVDNSTIYTTEVYTDSNKIGMHTSTLTCTLSLSLL